MVFDLDYIDRLISPEILETLDRTDPEQMTYAAARAHFEKLGYLYELEERCGILQFDGGLDREHAEQQAVVEMVRRMSGVRAENL